MAKKAAPKTVTQIVSADPFAAIASTAPVTKTKKSSMPTAEVTNPVKNSVDLVVSHKAEICRLEAELATHEVNIIDHVRPQQDEAARAGNYSKSFRVPGNTGALTYVTSDRFSAPKDTAIIEQLKQLIGMTRFEEWFETKRTIKLKPDAQADQTFIQKLVKVVSDAGMNLGDAFEVTDALVTKDGLDEKQFELPPTKLEEFRTLCRQAKPALK
jgi:hypothetical protein